MKSITPQTSICPTYQVIDALSKKWALLLLKIFIDNPRDLRFCELEKALPEINSKMLSDRLSELEELHLIKRTIANTKPTLITYAINPRALDLKIIFTALKKWVTEK